MEAGLARLTYRVILRREPEGGYTVTAPSLPGCVTYGADTNEAHAMAKEAVGAYLESMAKHGIIDGTANVDGWN